MVKSLGILAIGLNGMATISLVEEKAQPPAPTRGSLFGLALRGFLATSTAVVGGAFAGASAPGVDGQLWSVPAVPVSPAVDLVIALGLFYAGMILLVRSWTKLRTMVLSSPVGMASVALVISVWATPFALGPPLGSRDVYAYAAQGELADEGFDVYSEGPGLLGESPVLEPVDPLYLDAPVVYGPVFVEISTLVSSLTDGVVGSVLAFRALAMLGLMVSAVAVWDIARGLGRDPVDAVVLAIANPLALLHLVSGAHNEAMMLALLLSGVAIGRRSNLRMIGVVLCAVAASIKIPAILGVAFLAWPWVLLGRSFGHRLARAIGSSALALFVIGLAGRLTGWGWDWVEAMLNADPVEAYLSVTSVIGVAIHTITGVDSVAVLSIARTTGLLIAALATAWLLFAGKKSAPVALGWSLMLFAFLHPTTQPWYLLWGLMLLAATSAGGRNRSFVALSAVACFAVLPSGPQLAMELVADERVISVAAAAAALSLLTFSPAAGSMGNTRSLGGRGVVSVIVPTRNEAGNVRHVADRVAQAVRQPYELIFVDDSDDETPHVIAELCRSDTAVRLVHRDDAQRWGGLGGAVVDGFSVARGEVGVVLDGDLQHPPERIPELVASVVSGNAIAVASRRVDGGSDHGLSFVRLQFSRLATFFCRLAFPIRSTRTGDPLSGFFAVGLDHVDIELLEPDGFKILLELLVTHPDLDVSEVAYEFAERSGGASKADLSQGVRFLGHLVDLRIRTSRPWAGAVNPQRMFDHA